MDRDDSGIEIGLIPELPTQVAMPGVMRHVEVGGAGCNDTGIITAIITGIGEE
jgi:hypothetical protein